MITAKMGPLPLRRTLILFFQLASPEKKAGSFTGYPLTRCLASLLMGEMG
jgi:hypothetical protein